MSLDLSFARVLDAEPEDVFDAFTDPVGQEQFYGQDDPGWIVESQCDLRVGGVWTVAFGPSRGELYRHTHVFQVIDRPRRLVLTTTETRLDGWSFETELEFTFERHDGKTLMTMVQKGFPSAELKAEHERGLPNAFGRLDRVVRGRLPASVLYMSMSLDGFITGPEDDFDHGLGLDGERLHQWLSAGEGVGFRPAGPSGDVFDELMATGAVVVGRRTFDLARRWGGDHHGVPIFVPTRQAPPDDAANLPWVTYVTDGIESTMAQAKEAAGAGNILVHGAATAQSCLQAGVLDELEIHLIPVLLGAGRRLFEHLGTQHIELELVRIIDAPGVTHLRYRVGA